MMRETIAEERAFFISTIQEYMGSLPYDCRAKRPEYAIAHALKKLGYYRVRNVKRGIETYICATHTNQVSELRRKFLQELYSKEELDNFLAYCLSSGKEFDPQCEEFLTELLLEWVPQIIVKHRSFY